MGEASKKTLEDWGNTSSSSIWYEAEWVERFGNLQVGQRLLQISFGSGFKCNSAVWRALRVDTTKRGVPIKSCTHWSLHASKQLAIRLARSMPSSKQPTVFGAGVLSSCFGLVRFCLLCTALILPIGLPFVS